MRSNVSLEQRGDLLIARSARSFWARPQLSWDVIRHPHFGQQIVVFSRSRAQISSHGNPTIDIDRLTVGERLELIEQVWDSVRREAGDLPLNDAERAVIEVRRAEHRADPGAAVDWESVRADLLSDQDADEQQPRSSQRG